MFSEKCPDKISFSYLEQYLSQGLTAEYVCLAPVSPDSHTYLISTL